VRILKLQYVGAFEVRSPRERVYMFLTSPEKVAKAFPGVEKLEVLDENSFSVRATMGIGHLRGSMNFKLRFEEKKPHEYAKVVGRGTGLQSTADISLSFNLEDMEGDITRVRWSFEGNVGGLVGSIGGRILDDVAKKLVDEVISNIKKALEQLSIL